MNNILLQLNKFICMATRVGDFFRFCISIDIPILIDFVYGTDLDGGKPYRPDDRYPDMGGGRYRPDDRYPEYYGGGGGGGGGGGYRPGGYGKKFVSPVVCFIVEFQK